jgi:RNA-directed DNA polymerase
MGLFDFLIRLFFPKPARPVEEAVTPTPKKPRRRPRLVPLRSSTSRIWTRNATLDVKEPPYAFARIGIGTGRFLDLSQDGDEERLVHFELPLFHTPEQLASWLEMPLGRLAWLVHRFSDNSKPATEAEAHYHFRWLAKRKGGHRLIESPKRTLKQVQRKVLAEILNQVAAHPAAHGFTPGRSTVTNATPHVEAAIVLKFDLADFYASVSFGRVTAIFRGMGYSRESAIWLDVRLSGLARAFGANYTRYADDLTFSGPEAFSRSLRDFIPLVSQIIRQERFRVNKAKRKVIRANRALVVTGIVVNRKLNIRRRQYDRLKAVLHNCLRHGPASQNRGQHPRFADHLRGRVAYVSQLNAARGEKLLALYNRIDWKR